LALWQGLPSAINGAQRPVVALAGVAQKDGCPIQAFLWQSASGSVGSLSVAQKSVQYPTPVVLSTLRQLSLKQLASLSHGSAKEPGKQAVVWVAAEPAAATV
jgi:hypothetical protein